MPFFNAPLKFSSKSFTCTLFWYNSLVLKPLMKWKLWWIYALILSPSLSAYQLILLLIGFFRSTPFYGGHLWYLCKWQHMRRLHHNYPACVDCLSLCWYSCIMAKFDGKDTKKINNVQNKLFKWYSESFQFARIAGEKSVPKCQ